MTLIEAIETALRECKDPYARTYLMAADSASRRCGTEGLRVQLLYAVSNMAHWHGENARAVKKVSREHIEKLKA